MNGAMLLWRFLIKKKKKTTPLKNSHFLSETANIIGQNFVGPRILNLCVVVEHTAVGR